MTQAVVYTKTIVMPTANELEGMIKYAEEIVTWLGDKDAFRQDLKYLRQQGIKRKDLAVLFNVAPVTISFWQAGFRFPENQNQRCIVIIRELAKCLREQNKAQREAGLKPQVSYS
jgi:DNA-binding transcriptional regulator YiaG